MPKYAKRPPLSVEIAPQGDGCCLSITMSWDALSELLGPVSHLVEPKQIAARKSEAERQEAQKHQKARQKQNLAEGLFILEAYEDYRAAGQSSEVAWTSAANEAGHSVFNAQLFAKMARRERKASRDKEIIRLVEGGASIKAVADGFGLCFTSVYRIVKRLRPDALAKAAPAIQPKTSKRAARQQEINQRAREMLSLANGGMSNQRIADHFGVANSTVYRTLQRLKKGEGAGEESGAFSGDRARSARRKALDASEAPQPLPQGSGQGKRSVASAPFPEPLPTGEVRGSGGKAPGLRGAREGNGRGNAQ